MKMRALIARLAYLTTPSPGVYILNIQVGDDEIRRFEISRAHLANIIIDGTALALREQSNHRVSETATNGDAHVSGANRR